MTLLPKVKLKANVNFPATVLDGTGIDVTKSNGTYRFDLDFADFAPPVTGISDPAHQNVLLWNNITGQYVLVPTSTLIGTGVLPATAFPLIESGSGAVGSSVKYAREDHAHPESTGSFIQSGAGAVTRTMQNKAREIVSVTDFGADPTGVADSLPAIAAALAALPASGGDVHFPPGIYKINNTITLGNGTSSTSSTRYGMRLVGDGVSLTSLLAEPPAVKLLWGGGSGGSMIIIAGRLEGWGVQNIAFDGNSLVGSGLVLFEASFGDCSNLAFSNITGAALLSTTYSPVSGNQNSMHNCYRNMMFNVPVLSSAIGVLLDGASGGGNSCYNTFINSTFNLGVSGVGQTAIYLRSCDSNQFFDTHVFNGGNTRSLVLDYTVSSSWPASCGFYGFDPIAGGAFNYVNIGTPGPAAAPNWIYGLVTTNTAAPPNLPNLTYLAPYQLGGSQTNDSAVAGAVGECIPQTVPIGSAISLTNSTAANISGFSLSPGDWDVSATAYFRTAAGTNVTTFMSSISLTSAAIDSTPGSMGRLNYPGSVLGVVDTSTSSGPVRLTLASTTAVYHTALAAFSAGTCSVYGVLRARRMR